MIRTVYTQEPTFPASDQHPDAVRYVMGGYFVDAIGEPTQDDLDAFLGKTPKALTLAQIASLEALQRQKLTDRAEREFKLAVFALTGQTAAPAFVALKAIDDQIKALRAQL